MKFDSKQTTAVLFLTILFIISVGTGIKVLNSIYIRIFSESPIPVQVAAMNQHTNYEKGVKISHNDTDMINENSYIKKGLSLLNRAKAYIEWLYSSNIIFESSLVNIYGGFQKVMNKRMIQDAEGSLTVYKMKNGQLTWNFDMNDHTANLYNMKLLYDFVSSKNMNMLYVQAPFKVDKYDSQLPQGVVDTTNINVDNFISGLQTLNIPYLDLRDEILKEGLDYNNLFYNTDHHWKVETAFWAYGNVMNYLFEMYNIDYDVDTTNITNFKRLKLERSWLGSQGIRVGRLYAGVDDFLYLIPDFKTNYSVQILNDDGSIKRKQEGSFNDSIIMKEFLKADTPIDTSRFSAYLAGDYPVTQIRNLNRNEGKLLIIKDSYALPFSAFLSLNFKEVDMIDLRHFKNTTLFDYLNVNSYDLVLFLYSPGSLSNELFFTFQ